MNSLFVRLVIPTLAVICLFSCSHDKKDKDDKNILKECYELADQHWSKDEYFQWLSDSVYNVPYVDSDTGAYWDPEKQEWTYLSHHLPEKGSQQYYEMIGKYEQFRWGWIDYGHEGNFSQYREDYLECLQEAGVHSKSLPTMP